MWAFHDRLLASHAVKSTFWRRPNGAQMTYPDLVEHVGANKGSKDVHWPLSLALRPANKVNYRKRKPDALRRRLDRKDAKGYRQGRPPAQDIADARGGRRGGQTWSDEEWRRWNAWYWWSAGASWGSSWRW